MAAAVVADGVADIGGKGIDVGEELLQRPGLEIGASRDRLVQVGDVGLMVLAMVDLHRLRVDMGFQGVKGVGKRG